MRKWGCNVAGQCKWKGLKLKEVSQYSFLITRVMENSEMGNFCIMKCVKREGVKPEISLYVHLAYYQGHWQR